MTWSAVAGATHYQLLRDGAVITEVTTPAFDDAGADAGGAPAVPANVSASAGTAVDGVDLMWTAAVAPAGTTHVYRVRAVSDVATSDDSAGDDGFRAASPVTDYEVSIDGGAFASVGAVVTYRDLDAPAGSVIAGTASATAGTVTTHVALSLAGASAVPGAERTYSVRARNERGAGAATTPVSGYRGVGALAYAWQRSSGDSDADYSALAGATTPSFDDLTAPSNGDARYYRCVVSAAGTGDATTAAVRGYRGVLAPSSPVGVAASDGTSSSQVTVTWTPVAGATSYRVYRDAALVATVSAATADDTGASEPPPPNAPASPTASAGTYTDRVAVSWTAAVVPPGATHSYTVVASNAGGDSAPSSADTGYRAGLPVLGYEISIDGGAYVSTGVLSTYDDAAAPAGTINAGVASASELYTTHVALSLTGSSVAPGGSRAYRVRAVNAAGTGSESTIASGYRGVGAPAFQWQRSSSDADAAYSDLAGATTTTHDDTTVPSGAGRYYRCVVSAAGATSATSIADRGRRVALPRDVARDDAWVTDGDVYSMVRGQNVMYMGGLFTYVGPPTGTFTKLDRTIGQADLQWPRFRGTVNVAIPDASGGWYVGGSLQAVDGVPVTNLVHLLADGSLDPAFAPATNGSVLALALDGSTLYVGGGFIAIGGQSRNRLAALSATTGVPTAWNPNASYIVEGIVVSGSVVYVYGDFTTIGGASRYTVAALSKSTGLATAWNPNPDQPVNAIAVSGSTIFLGGQFGTIGGSTTRPFLAAVNDTTGAATTWNPGAMGAVNALALDGTDLYVAGFFSLMAGQTRRSVAAVNITTGALTAFNPQVPGATAARALAVDGGVVFVVGDFQLNGSGLSTQLASFDIATGAMSSWNPGTNGTANVIVARGGQIYVGGALTSTGGVRRDHLAAIDLVTGTATAWNPSVTGSVESLALDGGLVYVAGSFTAIGGQSRASLAAVDAATGAVAAWNPGANGIVRSLHVANGIAYVGGDFTMAGGQARNRLAAIQVVDGTVTSWNPDANQTVTVVRSSGDTIYAGGTFTTVGGQSRSYLAAISTTTGAVGAWNPSPDFYVNAIVVDGGSIYVGGSFTNIGGQARTYLAQLDAQTALATSWSPNPNGTVFAIALQGGVVYMGGLFGMVGTELRLYAGAADVTTGAVRTWNPTFDGRVRTFAFADDSLYVGGSFKKTAGLDRNRLAIFDP